jgi:ankyrin repeat protein
MPSLFVPFGVDGKFSLYKVIFMPGDGAWTMFNPVVGKTESIAEKFGWMQKYYKTHFPALFSNGEFQLVGKPFIPTLADSTHSIFLGLFLCAAQNIQRRVFKDRDGVTVTGDFSYNPDSENVELKAVTEIPEKFEALKKYAGENPDGRHLFLYADEKRLSSEDYPVPEGLQTNIEVKRFSSENTIFDVLDYVFKPYVLSGKPENLDETQERLFGSMNNGSKENYIEPPGFQNILRQSHQKTWRGFFIHGPGGSGKSMMAEAVARYLMLTGKIDAPVWITIDNNLNRPKTDRPADFKTANVEDYCGYLKSVVCDTLQIDTDSFGKTQMSRQFLFVFDNLEMESPTNILLAIKEILEPFYRNTPYVIITSRTYGRDTDLLKGIITKKAQELQRDGIELLVNTYASENLEILEKINAAKGTEEYKSFIDEVYDKLKGFPGLIRPAIMNLRYKTLGEEAALLNNLGDLDVRQKTAEIYEGLFQRLDKKTQIVLFLILSCSLPDTPSTKEQLFVFFERTIFIIKTYDLTDGDIDRALRDLTDYNFIYTAIEQNETAYALKSLPFLSFMFDPAFAGEYDTKEQASLREIIMADGWNFYIALKFSQNVSITEPILNYLEKKTGYVINDYRFFTAAEYATHTKNLDLLLSHGVDIDMRDEDGETAFIRAASDNPRPEILQWFLDNKADIYKKTKYGLNALHYAAMNTSNPEIIKWLLDKDKGGFDLNVRATGRVEAGMTPFLLALSGNTNPEIVDCFILEHKCNVNTPVTVDGTYLLNEASEEIFDDFEDNDLDNSNFKNLRSLVRRYSDVDIRKKLKKSALLPIAVAMHNPNIEAFKKILKHGVDIEQIKKYDEVPLLHSIAMLKSNPEYLELVKQYGGDINERDSFGVTALYHAAKNNGSIPVFNWFVDNGADLNATCDGESCFGWAVRLNQKPDVIEWFISQGIDFESPDEYGVTPFTLAAADNPNPEILSVFLKHGVDINARNEEGNTPLYYVSRYSPFRGPALKERIKLLLQYGADPDAKNSKGQKALPWRKRLLLGRLP